MPVLAIGVGLLLIAVSVVARAVSGSASATLYIPAALGALIAVAGGLALRPGWRRHAMHAAMAFALLGILGSAGALRHLPVLARAEAAPVGATGAGAAPMSATDAAAAGARPPSRLAVGARTATFALCTLLLAAGIVSFARARRARARGAVG